MTRSAPPPTPVLPARFGFHRNLLRPDDADRADRVTYIELFFDLIFVFALTQLSRFLIENQTPVGALQSGILVLALWWVWIYTTWVTNWLDPSKLPVRAAVIGLALIGLLMSTSIYESYGDRGLVFAVAYVGLQLGRTVFMVLAVARHDDELRRNFVRVLIWLSVAGIFWILGAVLPLEFRLPIWVLALAIEYVSAALGFRVPGMNSSSVSDWEVSGPHIAERSALFVIIALGESFLTTGFAFVEQEASVVGVLGVLSAFVGAVAMWWLYFDHGERAGSRAIALAEKPGRIARLAYTYVHALIIAGVVLTSVADEAVLQHPEEAMTLPVALTIAGGPALYLIGLLLFRWVVARELLVSHLVAVGLLGVAFAAAFSMSPLALGALGTGVLIVTAAWETVVRVGRGTTDEGAG
ncbi:MAG: Low temperature requirement protein LtrA [Microbacteriaceae bacterium]|nr:Low temperature requirement protein LtrA [Microbacteriaceae bacterium]